MKDSKNYKVINIDEILNYEENPRHEIAQGQHETLKMLIEKVGATYMFNLAKDIYLNGLIDANIPVVVWDNNKKKYIVYEGNRRIACIKILENPNLIESINKPLKERIEKLKAEYEPKYSRDIQCFVTDKEHAFFIMERIHAGEDKGRGLKAWSSREKQVFQERRDGETPIELLISQLNKEYFGIDITQYIKYTNIQRFFNNREVKKALKIRNPKKDIDKEKLILINYLIEEAIKKGKIENKSLSRLFNRARDIEDFFIPLITGYSPEKVEVNFINNNSPKNNPTEKFQPNKDQHDLENKDGLENYQVPTVKERKLTLSLIENNITCTNIKTINLLDKLNIENSDLMNYELLDITSDELLIQNNIVQPGNEVGNYVVIYTYYDSVKKDSVFWQDSLNIKITPVSKSVEVPKQDTVLSLEFVNKYYEFLEFEHSNKFKTLFKFLSEEKIEGRYSEILNITSRMFLEYSFRLYASEVLKLDNSEIDKLSKSLPSFIGYCCSNMDREAPEIFVKHITLGKKDAINKIDLLQKSVHYYNVNISPIDIQNIFSNLNVYLDYLYSKLTKASVN